MAKRTATKKPPSNDFEGNKYDKIVKENLEALAPAFFSKVLKIRVHRMENLPQVRVQTTKEVEADFVKIVYTDEYPEGCLLQLDFEAKDDKKTDGTMAYYAVAEYLKYNLPVDLRMIHLWKEKPKNITGKVSFCRFTFWYPIYYLYEHSYREFIDSDSPEEVIISILANPDEQDPETIIGLILDRLMVLRGDSSAIWKFINQLKILSMLRNLRAETEKKVHNMTITEDIVRQVHEDEMYQLGKQENNEEAENKGIVKGIEIGMEKGIEKGIEIGALKKVIHGIRTMTQKKFDLSLIAELLSVTEAFVLDIQSQLKHEKAIMAALKKPGASTEKISTQWKVSHLLVLVLVDLMRNKSTKPQNN